MHPNDALLPEAADMLGWIERICDAGLRRPGYPADTWTTNWVAQRFRQFGLNNVRLEEVPLPKWEPKSCSLLVWRRDVPDDVLDLRCFPLPHSAPAPGGIEAAVVTADGDVKGAIALETVTLITLPQSVARGLAIRDHDPSGELDSLVQTMPFGAGVQTVMDPALNAGAAGFIGIFDAPWESCDYYVPYDAISRRIPGVWISRADGVRLKALGDRGPVRGRINVESKRETVVTHNVVGTLPGNSCEWVIIGSHHDAPWASAVEDASGVALVLAQVQYWSRVPASQRPHNLLFLVTSGHMCHGAGTAAFIAAHADFLESVVLEVHLEHPAVECRGENGKLVPTGSPEVRWWFTSRNDRLVADVHEALVVEQLDRSLIMPPDAFGPSPTTDGGFFHLAGVPLVNFLTAPMYLFDSQDTPDKVHVPSLVPVSRAAIRIVASTRGRTAAELRTSA